MTADENAAIIKRGYAAFNSGDMNTLKELLDENAVWHTPGRSSLAGDHQGRDAAFAYFGQLGQGTGGTFRAELQQVLADDDDHVAGIHHNSAERDGKHLSVDCILVFQLKDGRITEGSENFRDLYAWDEFWCSPFRNEPTSHRSGRATIPRWASSDGALEAGRSRSASSRRSLLIRATRGSQAPLGHTAASTNHEAPAG